MNRVSTLGIRARSLLSAMFLIVSGLSLAGCSTEGERALSDFFDRARCGGEGGETYCYGDHGGPSRDRGYGE